MTDSNEKPVLLVLASTFPRWKDDREPRFVYDLCQRLKSEYKIIILAPHAKNTKKKESFDGLTIHRYRYAPQCLETLAYEGGITAKLKGNKLNYLVLPLFFLGQWLAIIKLLRQYPVKVIHAHWLIPQGILALMAKKVSHNKPAMICTSHGGDLYGLNDPISKRIKRYVIKKVDALTVVSTAMQVEVKKLVPDAQLPIVAPMGTDLSELFTPDESIKRKKHQLLFVGRLVEKKGLKYLLEALPKLIQTHSDICLNIAGTGPEQKNLEEQAKHLDIQTHINFLGRLSHKELVTQYRQAGLAVFPFIQAKDGDIEGLGLVMIEAMGCGCPVMASDIPAVRDVITDGKTGILFDPTGFANSDDIAIKILNLFSSHDMAEKLADQARKFVVTNFDWDTSKNSYLSIIERVNNNEK